MFTRNTFLSLSLASALMVSGINAAFACDDKSPQDRAAHLKKELKLTDDQTKKIEAIMNDTHKKMESLRDDTKTQIKAVLTDEQKKKFDEMKAKNEDKKDGKKSSY